MKSLLFAIQLWVLFSITACSSPQKEPQVQPNILWITNEDTSPAWGCYGDTYATTPHIDRLATESTIFTRASSNAPICAPARSTLITGMYATSLGTQHLRSDIPVPPDLKILPEHLREAGYYTTNNSKTDYNFSPEGRWDENSREAHWRNRAPGQPFFSVFNFGITHEGPTNAMRTSDTEPLQQHHDPSAASLPPYFPETDRFREIWAHAYDLMTVFDQEVGKLVQQLKEDGEWENTIIFVASDHGWGLPRHKRWLYHSGLRIPFILRVPEKFRHLTPDLTPGKDERMVGFVDFAPTVLDMAGVQLPDIMEGRSFAGTSPNDLMFGYRDRADDCYDMSRCVCDGNYIFIRNYMPHKPYIQNAVIFNKGKAAYEELFKVRKNGSLPPPAQAMFSEKPVEELYDVKQDPYQLRNLISEPDLQPIAQKLKQQLHQHMISTHDTGLLNEGIMMHKAEGENSVYAMAQQADKFPVEDVLHAAEAVGKVNDLNALLPYLTSHEPAVRYWGLVAQKGLPAQGPSGQEQLLNLLEDPSPVVAGLAAEILINQYNDERGYNPLKKLLTLDNEPVVLQIAINVRHLGKKAKPLVSFIQEEVYPTYSGEVWGRYRSWSYPMFIGMAFDQTLINCGEPVEIKN